MAAAAAKAPAKKRSTRKATVAKKATAPKANNGSREMTDQHKAALAEGRNEARIVGRYLDALEAHKPRRGRKRTKESVDKRLTAVKAEVKGASGLNKLQLLQEQRDLEVELAGMQAGTPDMNGLEADFVKVAKSYSARKGISKGAWREYGVSPEVLKAAGI